MNHRIVSITVSLIVLLVIVGYILTLQTDAGFVGYIINKADAGYEVRLFLLLFFGLPPVISIILSAILRRPLSQIILAAASLLYGLWFLCMAGTLFTFPSPEPGMHALKFLFLIFSHLVSSLFSVFVALPALLVMWIAALLVDNSKVKERQPESESPVYIPFPGEKP